MKINEIGFVLFCGILLVESRSIHKSTIEENDVEITGVTENSQQQILEELDLYSLAVMTRANRNLAPLADEVFKKKFGSKTIGIFGPLSVDPRYSVHILDSVITNYNYEVFALTLQTFGHLIKKVMIGYEGIRVDQRKDIHNLINKHCSAALDSIQLTEWDEEVLESFESALPMVKNLTIVGNLKSKSEGFFLSLFKKKTMKLNEIFPAIEQFNLDSLWVSDASILNVEFAQLERVSVSLLPPPFNHPVKQYFTKSKPALEKLFRNNPQVRDVKLDHCNSFDYLRIAAVHLPKLESLQVNFGHLQEKYTGYKMHFGNVKTLRMKIGNVDLSKAMVFKKCEDIKIECNDAECDEFPLESTENLKKLFLVGYSFKNGELLSLAEKTPFLEDLLIVSDSDFNVDSAIKYVVGSKKLSKMAIMSPFTENLHESFTEHLGDEWDAKRNSFMLTLEKQSNEVY